jgi:predicted dehydrogenase
VCDIWKLNQDKARSFFRGAKHDIKVYEDYGDMLAAEDKNIDAVVIATPDWMHAEHTNACLKKGKHVYCEKEMSNDLEKAKSMVLTQRETKKILQIGHQRRSNPRYIHAIDNVIRKAGMLGRVTHAYAQWNRAVAPFEVAHQRHVLRQETLDKYGYENMEQLMNWRWFFKYGGGPFADLAAHQVDLFNWVWDSAPVSVTATGGSDYYDRQMPDNMIATYAFKNKDGKINRALSQVLTTTSSGSFHEKFMGENGTLHIAEIASIGNVVQRESRSSVPEWGKFVRQGLIRSFDERKARGLADEWDMRCLPGSLHLIPPRGYPLPIEMNKPAHTPHLENFFFAVRSNRPDLLTCPAEVGYRSCVAVQAANRSAAERKAVDFKPEDFIV